MSDSAIIPHSVEAEEAVIGSLIINPDVFHECRLQLPNGSAEFYIHRHRFVWDAVEALVTAGTPVDFLTLTDAIETAGKLSEIGGAAFLMSLINQTPSSLNAGAYSAIIHSRYVRREMISAANTTASLAYNTEITVEEAASQANRALSKAISLNVTRNSMTSDEALKLMDAMVEFNGQQEELPGIPTPWTDYNRLLGGGAQKSDLNLVIGRPGKGKTTILMQIARYAARYGEGMRVKRNHVAIFSLEMPIEQLMLRLTSQISGIDYQTIRRGRFTDDQYTHYIDAISEIADLDMTFDYKPGASPEYIRSRCELLAGAGKLDLIVVDSLNLMKAGGNFAGREYAEADVCAKGLKNIAGDFSVPVWCSHQMNRSIEQRGDDSRPRLADMRDGGEQPADGCMFVWHEMDGERVIKSHFIQEKQRNGPTGDVPISWVPQFTRFENYASGQTFRFAPNEAQQHGGAQ